MVHFPTILVDPGVFHSPKLVNLSWQIGVIPKPEPFRENFGGIPLTVKPPAFQGGLPTGGKPRPPVTQNLGDKEMFW